MKFTIRKKIILFTSILMLLIIGVSLLSSTIIFNNKIRNDALDSCSASAKTVANRLGSPDYVEFIAEYKEKLNEIYKDNLKDIEYYSLNETDFQKKSDFFYQLTLGIFPPKNGFGLSQKALEFKLNYTEVIQILSLVATSDGMIGGYVAFYDSTNDNIVYMGDSTSSESLAYNFPGSIDKAPQEFENNKFDDTRQSEVANMNIFEAFAPIKDLNGNIIAFVGYYCSTSEIVESQNSFLLVLGIVLVISAIVILFAYLYFANRYIVKNIKILSNSTENFTSKLDNGEKLEAIQPDVKSSDEIETLSNSFYQMQVKIVEYISDIEQKTRTEAQMKSDLSIASRIQLESLPGESLKYKNIQISSFIKPAKEVGGDLFDYFVIDENKCFFVIADVSGKGVPAALFMMRGKEIIKSSAKSGLAPSEIANVVNESLCQNNKEGLFITAFMGVFDTQTKQLSFVRGGHEQPFLLRDGKVHQIGDESNLVLGLFDDYKFIEDSIYLCDGDRILLYTDGVNEAINPAKEEFGYDRIQNILEKTKSNILDSVYSSIVEFSGEEEQFDDITMLCVDIAKTYSKEMTSCSFNDIPIVTDEINELVCGLEKDKISELDIIIDELMNNCSKYAFANKENPVLKIDAKLLSNDLEITFTDNGPLFNPLNAKTINVEDDPLERQEGGMGIIFVKTLSDEVKYDVVDGKNQLIIFKKL